MDGCPTVSITDLPPEILEKIFVCLSSDLQSMRSLSEAAPSFHSIVCKVPVIVQIPLSEADLTWLKLNCVPVRYLFNCEIAAYVADQIFSLNLRSTRVAKLVGYDYQSRKCEVTPHYLQIVDCVRHRAQHSLRRLELNVDLSRGRRSFKFAEIITQFSHLRSLSIHFSAHIELNQRILNSEEAQNFIDIILATLTGLKTFNVYICPPRKLRISSSTLQEFGIFKSDSVEITKLNLPSLTRLHIHESTADLFRKIMSDRETGGSNLHRNLLGLIYDGCPRIRIFNQLRIPSELCLGSTSRPDRKEWTRLVNKALVKQYRLVVENEGVTKCPNRKAT